MNKKGFTLVEILAVIVLIVVISLVVFPSILNSIKSSQNEIDEATSILLINAAKLYVDDNSDSYKENLYTYCIPVAKLIDLGYLDETITSNKKDDIKEQIIKLNNSNYEVVTSCVSSNVYLVKFEENGGSEVADQYINESLKVKTPKAPVLEGYDFAGWYLDKELKTPFDFKQAVDKDLTLYAKWETEKYHYIVKDGVSKYEWKIPRTNIYLTTTLPSVFNSNINLTDSHMNNEIRTIIYRDEYNYWVASVKNPLDLKDYSKIVIEFDCLLGDSKTTSLSLQLGIQNSLPDFYPAYINSDYQQNIILENFKYVDIEEVWLKDVTLEIDVSEYSGSYYFTIYSTSGKKLMAIKNLYLKV